MKNEFAEYADRNPLAVKCLTNGISMGIFDVRHGFEDEVLVGFIHDDEYEPTGMRWFTVYYEEEPSPFESVVAETIAAPVFKRETLLVPVFKRGSVTYRIDEFIPTDY